MLLMVSTMFSSLGIATPINNSFAELIHNHEKTMHDKLREKYYYNNNEERNNNNDNNNYNTINYDIETYSKLPTKEKN